MRLFFYKRCLLGVDFFRSEALVEIGIDDGHQFIGLVLEEVIGAFDGLMFELDTFLGLHLLNNRNDFFGWCNAILRAMDKET